MVAQNSTPGLWTPVRRAPATIGLDSEIHPEPALRLVPAPGPLPTRRLVVVDARANAFSFREVDDLPSLLRPGDLVVVNDAATLPASVPATTADGAAVELRLGRASGADRWWVAVLGTGSERSGAPTRELWRTPTEHRGPPPILAYGDTVRIGGMRAEVVGTSDDPHWIELRFERDWLDQVLRVGEPVRYSYLGSPVALAAFQTPFATRPWASEAPSAALPLRWSTILGLRRSGIGVAAITHAAGLSSVDGDAFDHRLPLPERADVPAATVAAIGRTRARGGRVVAVGTTVVRALEGRVTKRGALVPGEEEVDLVLTGAERPRAVDGLLTKLHAPSESHFRVLTPFAPASLLARAFAEASGLGYRNHEFGDSALLLPR
jgi:S-adenosylmethionine:tRNA ribosyltransferase-isomerase